jgi:hypothetical protein
MQKATFCDEHHIAIGRPRLLLVLLSRGLMRDFGLHFVPKTRQKPPVVFTSGGFAVF